MVYVTVFIKKYDIDQSRTPGIEAASISPDKLEATASVPVRVPDDVADSLRIGYRYTPCFCCVVCRFASVSCTPSPDRVPVPVLGALLLRSDSFSSDAFVVAATATLWMRGEGG